MDFPIAFPLFAPWDFGETAIADFFYSDEHYQVFSHWLDKVENHLLMFAHNIMQIITQVLYFIRMKPTLLLNHNRAEFCTALPAYGTDEFRQLLDHHPLRIVYCSQWMSNRIMFLENIFTAPYRLFKYLYDHVTKMLHLETVEVPQSAAIAAEVAKTPEVVAETIQTPEVVADAVQIPEDVAEILETDDIVAF